MLESKSLSDQYMAYIGQYFIEMELCEEEKAEDCWEKSQKIFNKMSSQEQEEALLKQVRFSLQMADETEGTNLLEKFDKQMEAGDNCMLDEKTFMKLNEIIGEMDPGEEWKNVS
jgi:uncharacterized protein YpiB (UPF0302 family)